MKERRRKTEKIWLFFVVFFYVCYNLPLIPGYGKVFPAILHGAFTLIPLWISVYVGLYLVCKQYPLKKKGDKEDKSC